ncbi:S9 family peptidase [Evansella sp. AB-P1]|uniref:S9 family peptidase n=1 Tax=Evansella sp. AB-P1 TaxID=3037653 RepID=UPI00241C3D70|nr:S9 family peptidase [Evansella sp. AB-P1]MDG5786491.1 S9 family peptidase [Evansella sp. AB-P1]
MPNQRAITVEDLKKINVINEPQLSPDGATIAFTRQFINDEDEYTSHLFVQSAVEHDAVQWTFGKGRVSSPRFSPDGKWLLYITSKGDKEKPQLYLLSLDGGEGKPLTSLENGASQPIWSPDSKRILFTTSYKEKEQPGAADQKENKKEDKKPEPLVVERLKYKSDAAGFLDGKRQQIAYYDLETETVTFLTDDDFDHAPSAWSPDGKSIVYTANKQGDEKLIADLYLMDVESKKPELLTSNDGMFTNGTFSLDGTTIACYGHGKEFLGATHSKLWLIDVKTKERTCLTKDWDIHLTDAAIGDIRSGHPTPGPIWSKDNQKLYVTASSHGNTNFYAVDRNGAIDEIHVGTQHVYGYDVNVWENLAVLGISTPTNPGDLHIVNLETKEVVKLTSANTQLLKEVHIQDPEEINCSSSDGWNVHGWVLKPYNYEEGKKYPTILEIHGGPHAMYGNTFFHELQLLAAQGYFVIYSNPRGSHGYGQAYVDACRGDYGGMDYEDIMAFTDDAIAKYPDIDKDRLGVTGGSYGGFMTNWIVSHNNRFKAAATLRCISNWISFYGVSDIGYFFTEWEIGTDLLKDPEKLWNHSPIKYVNNIETPLLILHGEKDFRCPVEQAEQLFVALKHRGKETRFVRFPNSNHELSRSGAPYLRYARLQELMTWFEKYLKN